MKKVAIVDDMKSAQSMLSMLLSEYKDLEVVATFSNGIDFLDYIEDFPVDLVFLDIEMPELDGFSIAKIISTTYVKTAFAFATAYADYSLEAWGTKAIGYITKPYDTAEIKKVVEKLFDHSPVENNRVFVECFPNFNVYVDKKPIEFKSKKAKEIFAYLVYNRGGWVSINEICSEVLENMNEQAAKDSMRSYMSRIKKALEPYKIIDIIEKQYGQCRVKTDFFSCDYYEYLDGDKALFRGEFLKSYSWAEPTLATMQIDSSRT